MTVMNKFEQYSIHRDRRQLLAGMLALSVTALCPVQSLAAPSFSSRRISVRTQGTGPDVLLIPGLGSGSSIWQASVAAVPGYRYHLIQVKGFAGMAAEANASGAVVEPVAAEIARCVSAMGLEKPAIVGHSMGGMLAMLLAIRFPRQVGKIMVVDMTPAGAGMVGGTAEGMGAFATRLGNYFTGTKGGRDMFRQLMGMFSPDAADNDPDVMATALQELAKLDVTADLPKIKAPLTVLYATPANAEQRAAVVQRYQAAYAGAKTARLRPIGPSGHMIMFDQPTGFANELRAFLRG
ncbi:alpha/beta fold hydrolase [Rhizorhapis suberifaciens]|uniref:Pimeloyl-ACP methyl ester carboxylesterase n=1 Tax=Rhizorhapis suberifaciens TaxID=13656 RepID=A0A840HUC4_9SPHN|nr:alpha/beta hydrolase [Rhizorhapis suberifaciens]MBB4641197.1 pimeloyl-ACP methyl ester carboxylesterase [Rhizorhapis suberifaciens]